MNYKRYIVIAVATMMVVGAWAQNATSSPSSRFGYGNYINKKLIVNEEDFWAIKGTYVNEGLFPKIIINDTILKYLGIGVLALLGWSIAKHLVYIISTVLVVNS